MSFLRTFSRSFSRMNAKQFRSRPSFAFMSIRAFCAEVEEKAGKQKGSCKWFDSKKGFGFITPEDGGPDVFVHQTQIHAPGFRNLADGEPVEFLLEESEDGKTRAVQVTGPDGGYVQGAPRPAPIGRDDDWSF
eukprot:CAMPEP_0167788288 /NCGR_PEP_ID=MMETSP0111_2-20121227/9951_1 /TAXON_ID=91324 /ORGANISM="Lotharella globosa, Strain CCCM811" /LENGTH=132 /DNA_ID=CAMNT_0007680137 /DNA_START=49 /DNA_END=447 /DNA_ORIENTATION=-